VLGISYRALRLPFCHVAKSLEGKWGSQGIVEQRKGTLLGVGHTCVEQENVG
jgi:hypothetical protein